MRAGVEREGNMLSECELQNSERVMGKHTQYYLFILLSNILNFGEMQAPTGGTNKVGIIGATN